nr:immunoglobulin domain-containing protein [Flavisolibacter sp.]
GILLNSTQTGINLYYNSIHLYGNTLNETGAMSAGIYLGAGSVANIKNNIVVNNLGLTGTDGHGSVAIFLASANTQLADVNYNNYFVAPTGTGVKNIGQVAGTGSATLTAWVTASGKEANSMNIQPVFVSNTDLHLNPASNEGLSNKGTPIGGIATDYDGDTRSTSTPDPGADEFLSTVACTNPVITTQPSSVTTCLQQNVNFTVAATGTNLTYQWRKDNVNISGATAASYAVNNITAASAGSYTVQVSSGSCVVTSNAAVLTVSGPCTSLPTVDTEITSVVLMPNVVNNATTLRVQATRTMKIRWNVVDMNGKVVMNFDNQVTAGRNDIQVIVSKLGAGSYQIVGQTSKGRTEVVKFIKQ